jgi:hypothetical protein
MMEVIHCQRRECETTDGCAHRGPRGEYCYFASGKFEWDYEKTICEQAARIEALEAALKPFAQNVKAASLSKALGHITREHLLNASAALDRDTG